MQEFGLLLHCTKFTKDSFEDEFNVYQMVSEHILLKSSAALVGITMFSEKILNNS